MPAIDEIDILAKEMENRQFQKQAGTFANDLEDRNGVPPQQKAN